MQHVVFLILGLGNGAVFAALALALVVTYRSSGVVNFATGTIALYGAYTFAFLRRGEVFVPLPWLSTSYRLPFTPGLALSLVLALAASAAFGALLYVVVFRNLRTAPAVAKAVASIGVMVLLQAVIVQKLGTTPVNTPHIFPTGAVTISGINVNRQILWFAGTLVVVTALLWLGFRFTRFGLATRAAAETEKGALVTGLSPDRIALANWAISAAVAGLSGMLIAPIAPIVAASYTLYVVPALAAALVGGFASLGAAVGAGFVIGALNSELAHLQAQHNITWVSASGVATVVPLGLILVYLVIHGRPLPARGAIVLRTLGRAPRPRSFAVPAAVGGAVGVGALLATHGVHRAAVTTTMIFAVVALSIVVVTGFCGQISLAQLTLAGAAAFALNRLAMNMGVPFPIAPVLAALFATVVGVLVGLPALRVRGLPVAIVTMALAVALHASWFSNTAITNHDQTSVGQPRFLGINLAVGAGRDQDRIAFGLLCLGVLIAVAVGVGLLRRSRTGAAMLAVRANERSAAAAGIDVARTKLLAFAIGAFIAGLGGTLLAYQQTRANADAYDPLVGLGLFVTTYLAGITSIGGGVLAGLLVTGGIVYTVAQEHLNFGGWYDVIASAALIYVVVRHPEGLVEGFHRLADRVAARRRPVTARAGAFAGPVAAARAPVGDAGLLPGDAGPLLRLDDVRVHYGGVIAVNSISLDITPGSIVGVIGPNGAGKTTLIDAISGFATYDGSVHLAGGPLDRLRPHQRIRRGLGRTFQGSDLFEDLTVEENVAVGALGTSRLGSDSFSVDAVLSLLGLLDLRARPVRELSQGQRQMVSLARALAGRPRVVLLDEPAGGLDTTESRGLGDRIRAVRDAGITVVLIDHDMNLVLAVCDHVYVLDTGDLIASGTSEEVRANPRVVAAYLGTAHAGATAG